MNNFLAWLNTWYTSHKLSAHITLASVLAAFGTLFDLYNQVPQFQAWCQHLNTELPGWLEAFVSMAIAVLMWYWKTSKPAMVYNAQTDQTSAVTPGTTVMVPKISAVISNQVGGANKFNTPSSTPTSASFSTVTLSPGTIEVSHGSPGQTVIIPAAPAKETP